MTVDVYSSDRSAARTPSAHVLAALSRRWVVAAAGCAVMALSGVGLAGYLDLSSATAADAAPAAGAVAPG